MTRFITIAGRKQVGKDSSARIIRTLLCSDLCTFTFDSSELRHLSSVGDGSVHPNYIHIASFADALKDACVLIFGIAREDMETEEGKQKLTKVRWPQYDEAGMGCHAIWRPSTSNSFMTVREVLQFVGTDLFRNQLDPDIWVQSVFRKPWGEDDIVIIADARFSNEADIAKQNGILIRIERDTGLESDGHKSETALDDYEGYNYTVSNNSTADNLVAALSILLHDSGFITTQSV